MLSRFAKKTVDREWLNSNFPCMMACPAHTNAGRYVTLIGEGRFEEAYRFARDPNPLASICGRVCAHPCETACRRGEIDKPISIRALKRFLTERHGPESRHPAPTRAAISRFPASISTECIVVSNFCSTSIWDTSSRSGRRCWSSAAAMLPWT
jgi:NADPH-dependent glutamate synthase beta subunit-like oxidoreductase